MSYQCLVAPVLVFIAFECLPINKSAEYNITFIAQWSVCDGRRRIGTFIRIAAFGWPDWPNDAHVTGASGHLAHICSASTPNRMLIGLLQLDTGTKQSA